MSLEKKERERHAWRLELAERPGYCIVFSFGTNDLPRFPLYIAASYSPAKTRKELQESPRAMTRGSTAGRRVKGRHRENGREERG